MVVQCRDRHRELGIRSYRWSQNCSIPSISSMMTLSENHSSVNIRSITSSISVKNFIAIDLNLHAHCYLAATAKQICLHTADAATRPQKRGKRRVLWMQDRPHSAAVAETERNPVSTESKFTRSAPDAHPIDCSR